MPDYKTIHAGGEERFLSLHPRDWDACPVGDPRVFAGVHEVIPRDQWPEDGVDLTGEVQRILDQDGCNGCHSWSATNAHETTLKLAGFPGVRLSAGYLMGIVTGGQNEGAGVDQPWGVLQSKGQCLESTVAQMNYHPSSWPKGAADEAENYKAPKIWDCGHEEVFDRIVTALLRRRVGSLGTNAFGGGHAIMFARFYKANGVWRLRGANSWGASWTNCGQTGFWDYPENQLSALEMYGAVAMEAANVAPDQLPPVIA